MSETSKISKILLEATNIKHVPFHTYDKDFTFIVNGEEFKTCRFFSDLLSSKISQIHNIDPIISQYTINTDHQGNFAHIMELNNFQEHKIDNDEFEFIIEVIEQLGNDSIKIIKDDKSHTEINEENIFSTLSNHMKHEKFYEKELNDERRYISTHFYELYPKHKTEFYQLSHSTLSEIINDDQLQLRDEDQLLEMINELYSKDNRYETLYEHVIFTNVSGEKMKEFVEIFDLNDLTNSTWKSLSKRLFQEIKETNNEIFEKNKLRYKEKKSIKEFPYKKGQELNGIFRYLTNKTGGNIHDNGTIEITSNYTYSDHPKNVIDFDRDNYYSSNCYQHDAWICFYFKNEEVEISDYSIKSATSPGHVKNWIIEISQDGKEWTKVDEHKNFTGLNGNNSIQTFQVETKHFAKYVRFRHNGEYHFNTCYFRIGCIELFGCLK